MESVESNEIQITNRGMITIPLAIRKKYHLQKGQKIKILDRDGEIILIPLMDIESERSKFVSVKEMMESYEEDRKKEIELENRSLF